MLGFSWPETGGFMPFIFLGFVPLLFIQTELQQQQKRGMFAYAYIAFFIWNFISTWWIYCVNENIITKLVSAGSAILINPFFMACVFMLFHFISRKAGARIGKIAFITFWIAFEYIHLNWDLSYPWLNLGNAFANDIKWIQWYEYTGAFGGTLWILVSNVIIFKLLQSILFRDHRLLFNSVALLLLIAVPSIISFVIYNNYQESGHDVNIVAVQPNIDPYNEKYSRNSASIQVEKFLTLSDKKIDETTNYIIGPETALPGNIWVDEVAKSPIYLTLRNYLKKYPNISIVLGASMGKMYAPDEEIPPTARQPVKGKRWYDFYNSAIQVDTTKRIQYYHKSKLVLGVEMMPFPSFFRNFQDAIFDLGGTTGSLGTQKERSVFISVDDATIIAPVICWESVYGEYVCEYINKGAQLIFIMTNDGWWDDTPGYRQHMAYARLRAIETRRSVARSANTGISCFINQRGDILQKTKWWTANAIKGTLKANSSLTFYTKAGDYIARISSFIAGLLLIIAIVKKFIYKRNQVY